jgi:predicted metal-dependent phosphotriesterase family hydrolase
VIEILEVLSRHDVILSTGHLSQDEIIVLVRAAIKKKIKKILVTHPDHFFIQMPLRLQKDLAAKGVFFDRCFPTRTTSPLTIEEVAKRIREVGVASSVLTSDFGQPENPFPVEGLKIYIQKLIQQGFSDQEIDQMVKINPGRLLSLVKD